MIPDFPDYARILLDGFSEKPSFGVLRTEMDAGVAKQRARWSLPVTLLATPALLLFADVLGRLLVPGELRVSVVSAFIGAPVLIFLVRRKRGGGA